jgi:hypothetical protein
MSFEHDESSLQRFRAKWTPVRVKNTRQNKKLEPVLIQSEPALGARALGCNVSGFAENPLQRKNPLAITWTERFAVIPWTSNEVSRGKFQEWVQLNAE